LKLILESGTLQKGSVLTADNVLVPGAPDYIEFLQNHSQFKNRLDEVAMGPNGEFKDAVMVSEYLG
jgi:catechol O-methyltransferase